MTREEAIEQLKQIPIHDGVSDNYMKTIYEAIDMAVEALEQEPILDKIRAEIEQITDTMGVSYNQYVSKIDVLQIIDKYKAEGSEE